MAKIFMDGTAYFLINDYIHRAVNYRDDKELVLDTAYVKDGHVYVFRGELPEEDFLRKPASIYKEGLKVIWTDLPDDADERKRYSEDALSIVDMTEMVDTVVDNITDLVSPEVGDVGAHGEIFIPTIKETDDILTKIIKCAVITKQIDLANYTAKADSKWTLNNLKSNLISDKAMSYKYFILWCELLGLDFDITITDNGQDKIAPLGMEYQVDTMGRIFARPNGDTDQFLEVEPHELSKGVEDEDDEE